MKPHQSRRGKRGTRHDRTTGPAGHNDTAGHDAADLSQEYLTNVETENTSYTQAGEIPTGHADASDSDEEAQRAYNAAEAKEIQDFLAQQQRQSSTLLSDPDARLGGQEEDGDCDFLGIRQKQKGKGPPSLSQSRIPASVPIGQDETLINEASRHDARRALGDRLRQGERSKTAKVDHRNVEGFSEIDEFLEDRAIEGSAEEKEEAQDKTGLGRISRARRTQMDDSSDRTAVEALLL